MRNPVRGLVGAGLLLTAAVASNFNSARAEDCPGNPDALGTSRVLTIEARKMMVQTGMTRFPGDPMVPW